MSRRSETAMAPPTPRAKPSGRSTAEDLEGGRIWQRSGREEAGSRVHALLTRKKTCRPGKFFRRRGWRRRRRDLAVIETCRGGLAGPRQEAGSRIIRAKGSRRRAPDLAPGPSQLVLSGEPVSIPVDGNQSVKAQRSGVWMEVRRAQVGELAATQSQPDIGPHAIRRLRGCRLSMLDSRQHGR